MPKARELMDERVISVDPGASLLDVHRLFSQEGISGAPVVGEAGELEGVITNTDLVRAVGETHESAATDSTYFRDLLPYSSPDWASGPEDFQDRLGELQVADFMTRGVVSVPPDASASEVAQTLMKHRVHRLFVVEDATLLGVVSAFDLLRLVRD
jgi:CBS domain-containing protein